MVSSKQIHAFTLHLAIFYAPRTEFSVVKLQAFDSLISSLVFVKLRHGFLSHWGANLPFPRAKTCPSKA